MLREAEVGKTWEGEPRGSQDWGDDEVAVVPPVRPEVVPSLPEAEMIPLPMISQTLQKYVPGDVLGALRAEERNLGLVAEPPPAQGFWVSLATGCYRRGWQLRQTLGPNLLRLLPYRKWANWVISIAEDTDKEDAQLLDDILRDYGDFMRPLAPDEHPLLVVATARPHDGYYHASYSKNTCHMVALKTVPDHVSDDLHVLVSLDADNIIGTLFLHAVAADFLPPPPQEAWCE